MVVLSARYAKAIMHIAQKHSQEKIIFDNSNLIIELINNCVTFKKFLKSRLLKPANAKLVLKKIFTELNINLYWQNMLLNLATFNKLYLVPEIVCKYIDLYYQSQDIQKVTVESAFMLSKKTINFLEKKLTQKMNKQVIIRQTINAKLLGGFKIVFPGYILDCSVNAQINSLINNIKRVKLN